MGWFSDDSDQADAYNQVTQSSHKAELSHELLGAAASYEAMKAYEKHCAANGKPDTHAEAKELIAGFAGAFLDRVIETKGLDYIDKRKAEREAQNHVDELVAEDNY
ncbi:cipC protein [Aspergillus arachidicola]|nr:cipC protein [Aspergillus arachidicola]